MEIRIAIEQDMPAIFALRCEVFVHEQNVPPELELDAEDAHALHILAVIDGLTVGCARVVITGDDAHIGRLAVKRSYRGRGIGSAVCRFAIDRCHERACSPI